MDPLKTHNMHIVTQLLKHPDPSIAQTILGLCGMRLSNQR